MKKKRANASSYTETMNEFYLCAINVGDHARVSQSLQSLDGRLGQLQLSLGAVLGVTNKHRDILTGTLSTKHRCQHREETVLDVTNTYTF